MAFSTVVKLETRQGFMHIGYLKSIIQAINILTLTSILINLFSERIN